MDYIPSILNPVACITPLKQEFKVPLSFLHRKIGRSTTALMYACLYDSAIPVPTPYVYTTRRELERHTKIERNVVKSYLLYLLNSDAIFLEVDGRANHEHVKNQLDNDRGVVYRVLCQIKPVETATLVPYIKFKAKNMNKRDKCTYLVEEYLKEVSKILNSEEWEYPVDIIAHDLGIHRRNVHRSLFRLDKEGKIEWNRSKGKGGSVVKFI